MDKLLRSNDRKVANSFTAAGNSRIKNTFGLPAGKDYSCPGATSICEKICYAGKLEKLYKGVRENLTHNWELLREADINTMVDLLWDMIDEFEKDCDKWQAPKKFRIHWDGDFFNQTYEYAWQKVIQGHPETQFWAYTRVKSAALSLSGLDNLSLYFSTDKENVAAAAEIQAADLGVRFAGLADTFEEARGMLMETLGVRSAMCPELRKQIPLVGACVSCNICPSAINNITFSISKK